MVLSCGLFFNSSSPPPSSQDEKNQVLTTNIWLQMVSFETKYVISSSVFELRLLSSLTSRKLSSFWTIPCYTVDEAKLNGKT